MLEANTDRMWFTIGSILIGAALVTIALNRLPDLYGDVFNRFDEAMFIEGENVLPNTTQGDFRLAHYNYAPKIVMEDGKEALAYNHNRDILALGNSQYTLVTDESYTFSFYAKANQDMSLGSVYIARNHSNFLYGQRVTAEWKKYSFKFVAKSAETVHVHMYPNIYHETTENDTFYITDWRLSINE